MNQSNLPPFAEAVTGVIVVPCVSCDAVTVPVCGATWLLMTNNEVVASYPLTPASAARLIEQLTPIAEVKPTTRRPVPSRN